MILIERFFYHQLPVTGILTTMITGQSLLKFASARQKSEILPAVAEGAILAIAITEPEARSDVAGMQTVAVPDGDGWRLRGQKLYTTYTNHADWVSDRIAHEQAGEAARQHHCALCADDP